MFYQVLSRTLLWLGTSVSLKVVFGIAFAVFLSSRLVKGKSIIVPLLVLPWIVPGVVTVLNWRIMFGTTFGLINHVTGLSVNWLGDPSNAFFAYNIVEVWLAYPFMMFMIMAAMKNISPDLYESAAIDGAGAWRKLKNVTLPLIKKPLLYATLLTTSASFQVIVVPYLLNSGGPYRTNELIMVYGYREAFALGNFGYAAAFVLIASIVIFIIAALIMKLGKMVE